MTETMDANLLGSCGLYCRACPRYRVTLDNGLHLLELHGAESYEAFYCLGCHSTKLSEFCQSCKIRLCAKMKGLHHCGLCPVFPCPDLEDFAEVGRCHPGARHRAPVIDHLQRVNQASMETWLKEQDQRWRCSCGFIYSHYETTCHVCGETLDSYANAPSVRDQASFRPPLE